MNGPAVVARMAISMRARRLSGTERTALRPSAIRLFTESAISARLGWGSCIKNAAISMNAKLAAFALTAHAGLVALMRSPASNGPTIRPPFQEAEPRATAASRSSFGTRSGMIA